MTNIRANSFTAQVLYQLKKLSGRAFDIYVRGTVSQDVSTGRPAYPETKIKIKRAIVLPITELPKFTQAQNFAHAGRTFLYGGIYSLSTSFALVDRKDLPVSFVPKSEDAIIMDHRRYQVKQVEDFQESQMVLFIFEELKGQAVNEILDVIQEIALDQEVVNS